jgi:23S rRNA (guanine2445-N2)-methyltransferase / 23S rRNA (guanine2069-N7)-methyltransferase
VSDSSRLFVACARRLEGLVAAEVESFGAAALRERPGGVECDGGMDTIYRILLYSRFASRLLLRVGQVDAGDGDRLQAGIAALPWETLLRPRATLAVDFHGTSAELRHARYGAQRVKDGIVQRLTGAGWPRPEVDLTAPDARLSVRLQGERADVALDLSGESLHRRGYRGPGASAPLKEPLAAAILQRAGWPELARGGGALFDPCCGTGTLLIEGALMAGQLPLRRRREVWGLAGWAGHDPAHWQQALRAADEAWNRGIAALPPIEGRDADPDAVRRAEDSIRRAGLDGHIQVRTARIEDDQLPWPPAEPAGLLVANPPYGERLGADDSVEQLHMRLGDRVRRDLPGWRLAVLTADGALLAALGLRARRTWRLYNGALECRLGVYDIGRTAAAPPADTAVADAPPELVNRLRKNERHLARWRRRDAVGAWRLYDADLPEYALAVDIYDTEEDGRHVNVQEYAPPARIAPRRAETRRQAALAAVSEVLGVDAGRMHLRMRRRRRADRQYQRRDDSGRLLTVTEGPARFAVNLTDYLDTGLFLDHRPLRARIRDEAGGRRFLNLFCYTGTVTVQAALGGASSTTSVDLSRRYLQWMERNLALNGLDQRRHECIRADCVEWLRQPDTRQRRYDLILLDPPSVSRSKAMAGELDIQRDHVALIRDAAVLLAPGGVLYFSTNLRRFRLAAEELPGLDATDISRQTLPPDFARRPDIHHCWRITAAGGDD